MCTAKSFCVRQLGSVCTAIGQEWYVMKPTVIGEVQICTCCQLFHSAQLISGTLNAIAKDQQILEKISKGDVGASYSFMQISSHADLKNSEVVAMVKNLAKKQHSTALAQLACRIAEEKDALRRSLH